MQVAWVPLATADLHTYDTLGGVAKQRCREVSCSTSAPAAVGVNEQLVKEVAARCVKRVHASARPDRDDGLFTVGIVEDHLADRRRTGRAMSASTPPAGQLQHSGAHQSMG